MSLSLSAIADTVTRKVGQKEAADVVDCKTFASLRYQMIWNEALWKDAVSVKDFTLDVTPDTIGAQGYYLFPATLVDRVLAVRALTRPIFVEDQENTFASLWDVFNQTGDPSRFQTLPAVAIQLTEPMSVAFDTGGDTTEVRSIYVNDAGLVTANVPIGQYITATEFRSILKNAGSAAVSLSSLTQTFLTMAADDVQAPLYRRIRILPVPTINTDFKALVKTTCPAFSDDRDVTAITGVDNCLIEFVEADMLRRSRQHGKADLADKRGAALLDQLRRMETVQMAHNKRIEPADGYGTVTQQLGWDTHKF